MSARTGRPMSSRLRVRGWLRTESALHVGGLSADPADQLPVALDGQGRAYVPGTSIAGVLRAFAESALPHSPAGESPGPGARDGGADGGGADGGGEADGDRHRWGWTPRAKSLRAPGDGGRASRVIIADALITADTTVLPDGTPATPLNMDRLEPRTSVGIDRVTGSAVPEILFVREVVPAGCYLRFALDVESDATQRVEDRAWLGALLHALVARRIRLGAATSRGLGAMHLCEDSLVILAESFDSPAGLLAVLRDEPRQVALDDLTPAPVRPPGRIDVEITWRPRSPVMVRAGRDGVWMDTLALVTRTGADGELVLVLPGSSVKGALRAHAEMIERTARGAGVRVPLPEPGEPAARFSDNFPDQLRTAPVASLLFGTPRGGKGTAAGAASAVRVEECTSITTVPPGLWDELLNGPDPPPAAETEDTGADPGAANDTGEDEHHALLPKDLRERLRGLGMARADHVAIDRWTGGAAAGRLYSVLEPYGVEWNPLRLSIDLTRLDGADRGDGMRRDVALTLLLLALRDLEDGFLPLGAAVTRGFGDVDVTAITLRGGEWPEGTTLAEAIAGWRRDRIGAWQHYLDTGELGGKA